MHITFLWPDWDLNSEWSYWETASLDHQGITINGAKLFYYRVEHSVRECCTTILQYRYRLTAVVLLFAKLVLFKQLSSKYYVSQQFWMNVWCIYSLLYFKNAKHTTCTAHHKCLKGWSDKSDSSIEFAV